MLKARILTACLLIPIVFWLIFFAKPLIFLQATIVILLLASWEWSRLMGLTHLGARLLYFYLICVCQALAFMMNPLWIMWVSAIWWCVAFCLVLVYPRYVFWRSMFIRGLMGALVLIPCVIALNRIRAFDDGNRVLFYLLLLIWLADTAAFFVGRRFGVTKLAPRVSPGKSVQGVIGACVCTLIFSAAIAFFYQHDLLKGQAVWFIGISLITVLFSVLGDLFESMLKREIGVKDSGNLLPGHGGILDRIDSLTAAAPLFLMGLLFLK